MRIDILTLFPEMFPGVLEASILGKAQQKGLVKFHLVNYRDFANNKHQTVDDSPYGGGGGMVLKPEPLFAAVESLELENDARIILMCPQGEPYTQKKAVELAREKRLVFICGHYEGYDERIREHLVTDEISVGDYIVTGGELPAMLVIDSIVRLLPGALGNEESAWRDSYSWTDGQNGDLPLLEHPHYTRPAEFRGWKVPDVLLSGDHAKIAEWRRKESLRRTWRRRPDLLDFSRLTPRELAWIEEFKEEEKEQ